MVLDRVDSDSVNNARFVVVDFETVTPKGRPAEPIELAAMRIGPGLRTDPQFRFSRLIKPPDGAPITSFDTAQTGIRWEDVRDAPTASVVLTDLENRLGDQGYLLVAQNARYEAGIIARFADVCPRMAATPFLDTVALAKQILPGLANYRLDSLAAHFRIAVPPGRHRALPDVELTARVFLGLLMSPGAMERLPDVAVLKQWAGIAKEPVKKASQASLFDE
jgi:DNA polymerase-3 subunit epsilon